LTFRRVERNLPALSCFSRVFELDVDRLGRLAAAVDHSGDEPLAACGAGGPLADPCARHGFENGRLCHDVLLQWRDAASSKV
jgi:hypothetical protein